jgi:hypothetical protein
MSRYIIGGYDEHPVVHLTPSAAARESRATRGSSFRPEINRQNPPGGSGEPL